MYNRALGVFFLSEPPTQFDTLRDFRRHVGAEAGEWSPALHIEYRRAHEQRDYLLELAELEERIPPQDWRIDTVSDDQEGLAAQARDLLLAEAPLALPSGGDARQHLNAWTAAVGSGTGVLVMTTRRGLVSTREMRAFSLFFDQIPVIMLNGADSVRGRLFSLMHELPTYFSTRLAYATPPQTTKPWMKTEPSRRAAMPSPPPC